MSISVSDIGSLTKTPMRKIPAASTRISDEQIQESGARSLQELIEIYVPGVQWARHHWEFSHLGSRGVISDREDKVMIRLNGRVMNEHTHGGAITERNMPMLGDIHHIDVIRGPGSSLYGLGAVSMVIDIKTYNAMTKPGQSMTFKMGAGHEFQSVEGSFAKKLNNDTYLWLHMGVANVDGADDEDAPWILGVDSCPKSGDTAVNLCDTPGNIIPAGTRYPFDVKDGLQYKSQAPLKAHLQISRKNTDFWMRYTRAGETEPAEIFFAAPPPVGFRNNLINPKADQGYRQFTAFLEHRQQLRDNLSASAVVSFDSTETVRRRLVNVYETENQREQEWYGKLSFDWQASPRSEIALGIEYSHERFGLDGNEREEAYNSVLGLVKPWTTTTKSLLGEWQWRHSEQFTTFLGGRIDKNTYGNTLYSPRAALVWTPDDENSWKLITSRSQRMNFAEENREEALFGHDHSRPETLDSLELRYENIKPDQQWALSTFYLNLDAIGWDNAEDVKRSVLVAEQTQWGFEFEWQKRLDKLSLGFSHAYTKLLDFKPKGRDSVIAVEPFDDLNNWSNHISKFQVGYQARQNLKLNASLRLYWDFPGLQDHFEHQKLDDFGSRFINADWDKGSQEQVFLNAGASWQINKDTSLGLNLYNLMGLVDDDYNKRIYFNSFSDYRAEAPAAALNLSVAF